MNALTPAVVSALAGSVGVVVALAGLIINRRAQRVVARQNDARQPNLQLYLHRAQIHHFPFESARYFDCAITVTNASDIPNSIASFRLSLTRSRGDVSTTLEVEATSSIPLAEDMPATSLNGPRHLSSREVVEGRVVFRVTDGMLDGRRRQRYALAAIDANGVVYSTRIILINEHDHGNHDINSAASSS